MTNNLICPACGKEMKELLLSNSNIKVDICLDGCGGIYFDNRELKKVDEQHENIDEILNAIQGKVFKKVDTTEKRRCPSCGSKMVKNYVSKRMEIEIDECYKCGGKFFDSSELTKMREQYTNEKERSEDLIQSFKNTQYGAEMAILLAQKPSEKSGLRKMFDNLFFGK